MNKAELNKKVESLESTLNFAAAQIATLKMTKAHYQSLIARFRCPWYKRWWMSLRWVMKGKL
jgi:hypothetical protein